MKEPHVATNVWGLGFERQQRQRVTH